jgi:hypothetical protein
MAEPYNYYAVLSARSAPLSTYECASLFPPSPRLVPKVFDENVTSNVSYDVERSFLTKKLIV